MQEGTAEERRAGLHLFDVGTGLAEGKELRIFGLQQRLLGRYRSSWQSVDDTINGEALRVVGRRGGAWALYCVVLGLGLAYSTNLVIHGHSTAGDAFLVVWVLVGLGDQGANLAGTAAQVETTLSLAEQFVALRDDAEAQGRRATPHGALPAPDRMEHGIELTDVGFRYSNAPALALDGISMLLPAGAAVAVVGDNGAGKSTLVNLLLGLQRPTMGHITVDGVSLAGLDPAGWFARTSVVCQDFARLEFVVRESVGVGHLPALENEEQVRSAIGRGGAEPIVRGLPEGLEAQLGARFGGTDLSGGEWQRLAVARSMMRHRPVLLVLDEPTVSLDAMTERALFSQLIAEAHEAGRRVGTNSPPRLPPLRNRAGGRPDRRLGSCPGRRKGLAPGIDGAARPLRPGLPAPSGGISVGGSLPPAAQLPRPVKQLLQNLIHEERPVSRRATPHGQMDDVIIAGGNSDPGRGLRAGLARLGPIRVVPE